MSAAGPPPLAAVPPAGPARFLSAVYRTYRLPRAATWRERGALLSLCLLASTLSGPFALKSFFVVADIPDLSAALGAALCDPQSCAALCDPWVDSILRSMMVLWESAETRVALAASGAYVALAASLLFASKQLRCVSLLAVPALGTKRGRGYVVYAAAALLAVHAVPNTFHNVRALGELSLCKALSGIDGALANSARRDAVVREYSAVETRTVGQLLREYGIRSKYDYDVETRNVSRDVDSLRAKVGNAKRKVSEDFEAFRAAVEAVRSAIGKAVSVASMLLVVAMSAGYLRGYLTDVLFDNIYITGRLRELARRTDPSGEAMRCLKADGRRRLVDSTSLKLSKKEMEDWPLSILTLFAWLLLVSLAIGAEYGVHALAATLLALADTIPSANAEMLISYQVYVDQTLQARRTLTNLVRKPRFSLVFAPCRIQLAPPALHATVGVYALLLLALALVFLGSYAYRLRRKIAANFFPEVESKRVVYLHARMKTLHRHKAGRQKAAAEPASERRPAERGFGRMRWKRAPALNRAVSEHRLEVSVMTGRTERDEEVEPMPRLEPASQNKRGPVPVMAGTAV